MRKLLNQLRYLCEEYARYRVFYSMIFLGCPVLYLLLLWLENWANVTE